MDDDDGRRTLLDGKSTPGELREVLPWLPCLSKHPVHHASWYSGLYMSVGVVPHPRSLPTLWRSLQTNLTAELCAAPIHMPGEIIIKKLQWEARNLLTELYPIVESYLQTITNSTNLVMLLVLVIQKERTTSLMIIFMYITVYFK